jgi:D-alanyl-D-alanine carboxypeptidase/D-alanyl-D-alanine-endopeptidase (penicillin-binding protein 4)
LILVVDGKGNELVAQNADEPFVPASVTKIVTAWLAVEVLGGDYRFETRFYLDDKRVLYVRGGGDPFLISEELALLATDLVAAVGKQPIDGIVLDASYYPSNLRIPGIEDTNNAYNALNSALAVNFNTIYAVRSGNKVSSAEKQTPITPLAIAQFRARGPKGSGQPPSAQRLPVYVRSWRFRPSCSVPECEGIRQTDPAFREALWARYFMAAPRPRTPSELRYSDRRLRSKSLRHSMG